MSWQLAHLYAFLSWPPLLAVLFIASCRLNAMPRETLFPVVLEYALWAGIAVALLLAPLVGDWPGPVVMLVSWALAAVLFCSRRAWAGDVAPDVATDVAPLSKLPEVPHDPQ